ncbi:MAG TPA: DUF4402 domain-containing protein [Sphingomicrobium sp.]|nr:DUF4402 domain-containing protein [Sphingomicrobium sp.]
MRLKICFAAAAATLLSSSPAFAQAVATANAAAEARGVVLQPLTLTKLSDLDFGWVISTNTAGSVSVSAETGARSASGGVGLVAGQNGGRGSFAGAGTAGNQVVLTLNPAAVLTSTTNPANTINVSDMRLDGCGVACVTDTRTINNSGAFQVGVGGDFDIAANQPNGLYTATFDLTAEYQ